MKYLVTGGMGFIGSNFVRSLLSSKKDVKIINLDKLTYAGNPENLRDIENDDRHEFVKGDICDKSVVESVMKDVDVVVNFAAETHVDRSIHNAGEFLETDVFGTFVLLETAKKVGIDRFVQISTDEVYGQIPVGQSSIETDTLMPRNPYSASKCGADRLAYSYYSTYDLLVIITRASNNYGPFQYPEKLIPLFVTNLMEGKKVPVYGDGMQIRDWLHVDDHCSAIEMLVNNGKLGEVYNIGGGNEKTNIEITKTILDVLGKDENMIEYVKDRPGHDRRYSLDTTKLESIGWTPSKPFKEGMEETIRWYVDNEPWWQNIKSEANFKQWKNIQYGKDEN